jgi:hypothetical protein
VIRSNGKTTSSRHAYFDAARPLRDACSQEVLIMFAKWKLAVAASLALVGAAAGVSMAKGGGDEGAWKQKQLEKYDLNKDGKLDEGERAQMREAMKAKRQARIAKFDLNKDGKLDAGERAAMKKTESAERFKKLDANGDGVLSLDEFSKMGGGMRHHGGKR